MGRGTKKDSKKKTFFFPLHHDAKIVQDNLFWKEDCVIPSGVTTQTDSPRFFRGSSVGTPVRGVYFFFVVFGFRHPGGFETW